MLDLICQSDNCTNKGKECPYWFYYMEKSHNGYSLYKQCDPFPYSVEIEKFPFGQREKCIDRLNKLRKEKNA